MGKNIFIAGLLMAAVGFSSSANAAKNWKESNGHVIMEIENTESPLDGTPGHVWVKVTAPAGYTGTGGLEFTGNDINSGPPRSPLSFPFTITNAGIYRFYFHMHQRLAGAASDKCNDVYIRVEGDYQAVPGATNATLQVLKTDYKVYGNSPSGWKWSGDMSLDLGGDGNKRAAIYDFPAGQYKLVVSGRAQRTTVNRLIFTKAESKTIAQTLATPESATGIVGIIPSSVKTVGAVRSVRYFNNALSFEAVQAGVYSVSIFSASGKLVLNKAVSVSNSKTISVEMRPLAQGTYCAEIVGAGNKIRSLIAVSN